MDRAVFKIEEIDAGDRIDLVLSELLDNTTRSGVQRHIEKGRVSLNGRTVKSKSIKLKEGDLLEIFFEEPVALEARPEDIPIDIIYEDEDLIIVNKPKGMVVHPAPGNYTGTLVNGILYHCRGRLSSINGVIRPGIVHRIDKDTSGLMVVAKNDLSHRHLADQFANHSVKRLYHAIVFNNFTEDEGAVDAPIGRDPKNRLRMAVTEKNSKEARTHYKVIERFGQFTHIEAELETGRTHQIRVHMAHINHPLVGDEMYGPKKNKGAGSGQMLHAKSLGFVHPGTLEYLEFDSDLPEDFTKMLESL